MPILSQGKSVIDEMNATTHSATASSLHDDELSLLLKRGGAALEPTTEPIGLEADCFPLDGVIDAAAASARARSTALHTRNADLAREVLARAEHEVRDLLAKDPRAPDWTRLSADIVARAQRQVREILAQGRNDAEVLDLRADLIADTHTESDVSEQATSSALIGPEPGRWQPQSVEEGSVTMATGQPFATLRAVALPSEAGTLRYRVSGQLTLATMFAFQYAVSRLPGVASARVDPEPQDLAVLSMLTNDSILVHRQLERMPGVRLQMDPA